MNKEFISKGLGKYKKLLKKQLSKEFKVETIKIDKDFFSSIPKEGMEEKQSEIEKAKIKAIKSNPVLYWFSFEENFNRQEELRNDFLDYTNIIKSKEYNSDYDNYRKNPLEYKRAVSAIKNKFENKSTETLYVGKVKKDFWFRIITHCGWAPSPKTAGLQLKFWYDFEKFPPLVLNYFVFDNDMDDFVSILEIELSKQLKPLIGKK
ncbi:hypothetical protein [Flavobacterium celericrescens]|uniref:Uncharacterized protein n=1 Tax=Flavobacterium celericrescens TaxID=2709780 RepID=A0ABX0IAH0_9FLAO|nr:hypothetical protein [Flavobacterium celericrescens]NHM04087.1 hypothetical protein [Flavobacterium celericrescens]